MADILFAWPQSSIVGTRIPKERFYAKGTVLATTKEKFVSEVSRITWSHKLSGDTINIPGIDDLLEIDVFQIDTKDGEVSDSVLAAIDKSIPRPLIFEVTRPKAELGSGNGLIRMVAAHKQPGAKSPKLSSYYSTNWLPATHERAILPHTINLQVLYAELLEPLIPAEVRPGDKISDVAERLEDIQRLDKEIATLERKLRNEPQLNRKVELRRELKTKQAQREKQK